jgi:L-alanine-DL-glutamate epimerase-like enolase superfamily enzyme
MLDCYMSLTVPYAIDLCKKLSPLGLKWMEEYLPPDDYAGHAEVKAALQGVPRVIIIRLSFRSTSLQLNRFIPVFL